MNDTDYDLAYDAGYDARIHDWRGTARCPHPAGSDKARAWWRGYNAAVYEEQG